jgi:hypothetical protein
MERESILAFQKVSHLLPAEVPIILESRVEESEINEEIETALDALNPAAHLASPLTSPLGKATTSKIFCHSERRKIIREADDLSKSRNPLFAGATTNRGCPMSRVFCETWDSTTHPSRISDRAR